MVKLCVGKHQLKVEDYKSCHPGWLLLCPGLFGYHQSVCYQKSPSKPENSILQAISDLVGLRLYG